VKRIVLYVIGAIFAIVWALECKRQSGEDLAYSSR
jgi:hypothetical protein